MSLFICVQLSIVFLGGLLLQGQERNPTNNPPTQALDPQLGIPVPIFRIEVVERTTRAVNYFHRSGSTKIDFHGTPLMAASEGMAEVASERGVIHVKAEFKKLAPPRIVGPEYFT